MQLLSSQDARTYSTFRLPATFQQVFVVESLDELMRLRFEQAPLVLGEGSNSIFLSNQTRPVLRYVEASRHVQQHEQSIQLHVGAGHNWHQLVAWTVAQGWWGLENLALIPGSVGAAPVQNIGAYGVEFADCCDYVDFYHFQSRQVQRLRRDDCAFGYRDSCFKQQLLDHGVIVAVGLRLTTEGSAKLTYKGLDHLASDAAVAKVFETVIALRQSKLPDPSVLANCGSFFKNPVVMADTAAQLQQQFPAMPVFIQTDGSVKLAAAWLLEQCGFKGQQADGIGCYAEQPLVLVNHGTGTASGLIHWIKHITAGVYQRFGVRLEPEVRLYGG